MAIEKESTSVVPVFCGRLGLAGGRGVTGGERAAGVEAAGVERATAEEEAEEETLEADGSIVKTATLMLCVGEEEGDDDRGRFREFVDSSFVISPSFRSCATGIVLKVLLCPAASWRLRGWGPEGVEKALFLIVEEAEWSCSTSAEVRLWVRAEGTAR